MRKCKIDNKAVIARNAHCLGFSTNKIKAGSYFVFDSGNGVYMARSLGRVSAPAENDDIRAIKGFVLAMVWYPMGYCAERWIDPDEIIEAYDKPPHNIAALFFAPTLPYDAQTMRDLMAYGTMSERYVQNAPSHVAEWKAQTRAKA